MCVTCSACDDSAARGGAGSSKRQSIFKTEEKCAYRNFVCVTCFNTSHFAQPFFNTSRSLRNLSKGYISQMAKSYDLEPTTNLLQNLPRFRMQSAKAYVCFCAHKRSTQSTQSAKTYDNCRSHCSTIVKYLLDRNTSTQSTQSPKTYDIVNYNAARTSSIEK